MITKDREYRSFIPVLEEREDGGAMLVTGKPVIFNSPEVMYEYDGIEFKEQIAADAFIGADMSDVVFNIDHCGKPAAKTKNGSLKLDLRADGLYMEADLTQNATGRELYEDIKAGFYDKMSFAFTTKEESYDKSTRTRTILKVDRLYDVSAVTWPAYNATTISARSWAEAEAAAEHKALEDAELRKMLIVQTLL